MCQRMRLYAGSKNINIVHHLVRHEIFVMKLKHGLRKTNAPSENNEDI